MKNTIIIKWHNYLPEVVKAIHHDLCYVRGYNYDYNLLSNNQITFEVSSDLLVGDIIDPMGLLFKLKVVSRIYDTSIDCFILHTKILGSGNYTFTWHGFTKYN